MHNKHHTITTLSPRLERAAFKGWYHTTCCCDTTGWCSNRERERTRTGDIWKSLPIGKQHVFWRVPSSWINYAHIYNTNQPFPLERSTSWMTTVAMVSGEAMLQHHTFKGGSWIWRESYCMWQAMMARMYIYLCDGNTRNIYVQLFVLVNVPIVFIACLCNNDGTNTLSHSLSLYSGFDIPPWIPVFVILKGVVVGGGCTIQ